MDATIIFLILLGLVFLLHLCQSNKEVNPMGPMAFCGKTENGNKTKKTSLYNVTTAVANPDLTAVATSGAASFFESHDMEQGDDCWKSPNYWWMPGNIYYTDHQHRDFHYATDSFDTNDWMTDPLYAHMPGNIYHNDYLGFGYGCCTSFGLTDWINDPNCFFMPGNIFYNNDMLDNLLTDNSITSVFSNEDSWSSNSTIEFNDDNICDSSYDSHCFDEDSWSLDSSSNYDFGSSCGSSIDDD
jgi:hypothetical protein